MTENTKHDGHSHESKAGHTSKKIKKIHIWKAVSAILGLLFILSVFTGGFRGGGGSDISASGDLSANEAADKAIKFINSNVLTTGQTATLKSIEDDGLLYKMGLAINNQEFESYMTKDGKLVFPSVIEIGEVIETPEQPEPQQTETTKKKKTEVDLFVMSYCPYGTQAQKAMVPVMSLLGDKADINIRFVDYIMHGKKEIDENTVQYCIQKEEREKLVDYLECFLESMDSESCIKEANINKEKMDLCVSQADKDFNIEANFENEDSWLSGRYPLYEVDKELNTKYNVRGSPHLVINGATYNGARTSEAFKQAICAGFEEPPEECNNVLSGTAAAASGSCS